MSILLLDSLQTELCAHLHKPNIRKRDIQSDRIGKVIFRFGSGAVFGRRRCARVAALWKSFRTTNIYQIYPQIRHTPLLCLSPDVDQHHQASEQKKRKGQRHNIIERVRACVLLFVRVCVWPLAWPLSACVHNHLCAVCVVYTYTNTLNMCVEKIRVAICLWCWWRQRQRQRRRL